MTGAIALLRGLQLRAGWMAFALVFGIGLGSGAWVVAGAMVGLLLALLLLLAGPWWMAMAWMAAAPTVGVFFNNALQGVPFVRADRLLMLALLAVMAAQVIFTKRKLLPLLPVERCMAAFLALGIVHVIAGLSGKGLGDWIKQDAALLFDGYLMPMAAFFIARRLPWTEPRARQFLWLMAGASLFLAFTAPLETLLGVTWFIPNYLDVIHVLQRATGTFGNAAFYGQAMGSLLLLAALLYTRTRGPEPRVLLFGVLLAVLAAIVLCKTRASWLGVAAALAFVFLRDRDSRPLLAAFAVMAALAATVAVPLLLADQGFQERVTDTAPIYNRIAGLGAATNMMLSNPLTGVGLSRHAFGENRGQYAIDVGDVSGAWIRELAVPHNEFFNVGAMMGLLGFVLYLRVFVAMFRYLGGIARRAEPSSLLQGAATYAAALWVGWCVNASFADFVNFGYGNSQIYFVAGLVAALADAAERTAPATEGRVPT